MSAERTLSAVVPTPSATTSPGPSAVSAKKAFSSAAMGKPALVSGVCVLLHVWQTSPYSNEEEVQT